MSFVPTLFALLVLASGALASEGSPDAVVVQERPPYASLEESLTTFKGNGFEIEIAHVERGPDGGKTFHGLMKDGSRLVFEGEVTQITGDWDLVHFFRDRTRAYLLRVDGVAIPIPGGPLSDRPFKVLKPDPSYLPEGAKGWAWRAIEVERADGTIERIWGDPEGKLYLAGKEPAARAGTFIAKPYEIPRIYATLSDFRSRFDPKPVAAEDRFTAYHVWASTADAIHDLHFDLLELRPEEHGLQAYVETRARGKDGVRRAAMMLGAVPHSFLSTVYHSFRNQKDRPAFNQKLMDKVMTEDATLGIDRLAYVWSTDQENRIVGGVRLYQGYESDRFLSKRNLLPIERSHGHLDVRGKFPGQPMYEMNRLAIRKDFESSVSTKKLFSVMAQYMAERDLPAGTIIFHTDEWGAGFFPGFTGATKLFGPEETKDGTYVLSISTEAFKARMIPESPLGKPVHGLRLPRKWCRWTLSP